MKTEILSRYVHVAFITAAALSVAGCSSESGAVEEGTSNDALGGIGQFHRGEHGHNVLIVGIAPEAVDLTDPSLPPGLTVESIRKGLEEAQAEIAAAGDQADLCMILPDASAEATVHSCFAVRKEYDCVVIGAGIRLPPANLILFENVMNAIHHDASRAALAFNSNPKDSADAAARVLAKYKPDARP